MTLNLITPSFPKAVFISGTSLVFTRADNGVVLTAELPTQPVVVGPNGMSEKFPIQIKDVSGQIMVIFDCSFVMALTNQGMTDSKGTPLAQVACKFLFLGSFLRALWIRNPSHCLSSLVN